MAIDITKMNEEFNEFFAKYKNCDFEGATDEADYVADADKILSKYDKEPMSEEEKQALSEKYVSLGCKLLSYTDNPNGPEYYHRAIELQPDSYDIRWDYYTTLEETVENPVYARSYPELVEDAIECLEFCIDYCTTPELRVEKHIENRYFELARIYMIIGKYADARDCAEKSLEIKSNKDVRELYDKAKKLAAMTDDINALYQKHRNSRLKTKEEEREYISDADKIAEKYEGVVKTLEEKKPLCDYFGSVGSRLMMYAGNLTDGRRFYHKAMELLRFSFDVHWKYYTTLEEIIEEPKYATPELIEDAIKCLTVCISALTTPALKRENCIEKRYCDLAKVYMIAKDYAKAKECAEKSLEFGRNDYAQKLLDEAEGMLHE